MGLVALYFSVRYGLKGLGDTTQLRHVLPLVLLFLFLVSSKKTYFFFVLPLSLLVMLYAPFGRVYGRIDYQALSSLLATDLSESIEFLSLIPAKVFLKSLYVPLLAYISYLCAQKSGLKPWRNKTLVLLSLAAMVVIIKPTQFIDSFSRAAQLTKEEKAVLQGKPSSWGEIHYTGKPKDYVLIIGESARRDYFHLYGYPVKNTPFFDSVSGITVVDGLTSGGTYTIGSLTNMLTSAVNKWHPSYDRTVTDLAKAGGIETYWISNQGYVGKYDTPVSSIGARADHVHFLNMKSYDTADLSDFLLMRPFVDALRSPNKTNKPRLFILHTMGSHPDACKRIIAMPDAYKTDERRYKYLACYASSIKKADQFTEKVYHALLKHSEESKRAFSIIFFSDHGMVHRDIDGKIVLNNNTASKFHYDIPLMMIDSEAEGRRFFKTKKSGLRFTDGIGRWLNLEGKTLAPYDLFDNKNDEEDFGLADKIKAIKIPADPAVDISEFIRP